MAPAAGVEIVRAAGHPLEHHRLQRAERAAATNAAEGPSPNIAASAVTRSLSS